MQIRKVFVIFFLFQACLLWLLSPKFSPFTFDSMIYVSTGQSIHQGEGLTSSNFYIETSDNDFAPLNMEPPGYPILISLLMFFGFNSFTAGLLVPRLCFLFLPFLFYLIFKRLLPATQAMIGALVCSLMFSVVQCALMAWSDLPCLLFSLMALLMAFYILEKRAHVPFVLILLAGAWAGYVYLLRFVGVTLIFSIALGSIAALCLKLISKKDFFKAVFGYALGVGLVIAPYLYRNWHLLGSLQSYAAAPSHVPLAKNILDYLNAVAGMLWGTPSLAGLAVFFIVVVGGFILALAPKLIKEKPTVFVFIVILSVFFLTNSIVLIAFRSIWFSYEIINSRYLVQIVWILMLAMVFALSYGIDALKKSQGLKARVVAGFLLIAFIFIQVFLSQGFLKYEKSQLSYSQTIGHYVPLLQKIPKDVVIVTNFPDLLYYHLKRNVRSLNFYTPNDLTAFKRKFVVFLLKDGWNIQRQWGWYNPSWASPHGYRNLFTDEHVAFWEQSR